MLPGTDVMTILQALPGWLARQRALMPALERLGVSPSVLALLRSDGQLLDTLGEASRLRGDVGPYEVLQRVLTRHEARLQRITSDLPGTSPGRAGHRVHH